MSATTTTPPAKAATPQESDEEIMKEWDGVLHFVTRKCADGSGRANCGAKLPPTGGEFKWNETLPDECPLCQAIHEEIVARDQAP